MKTQVAAWDGLDSHTLRAACTSLRRIRAAVDGHLATATQALERAGVAGRAGATSTGAMLSSDFGGDRRSAEASLRTGRQLEQSKADHTRVALVGGQITQKQADIITGGLLKLPKELPAAERTACEKSLIDQAKDLTIGDLRRAADRTTAAVEPPETVDQRENSIVEQRERAAWRATELWMSDQGDGTIAGRFRIPTAQATMLSNLLQAQAAPRRSHLQGAEDPDTSENLTYAQRAGRAFCALIEHVPTDGFATSGGTAASVTVTMDLDSLMDDLAERVAVLPTGTTVSAGQARRLACSHGIIPQVLSGASLPLDLGRSQRLFSATQRKALAQRDRGCAFPGCDRPPGWCESHHIVPFGRGGTTDLTNGVMLCSRHHHMVHDDRWSIRIHPRSGLPEFAPPGTSRWRPSSRYRPQRHPTPTSARRRRAEGAARVESGARIRPDSGDPAHASQALGVRAVASTDGRDAQTRDTQSGQPQSGHPQSDDVQTDGAQQTGVPSAGADRGQVLELFVEGQGVAVKRQVRDGG